MDKQYIDIQNCLLQAQFLELALINGNFGSKWKLCISFFNYHLHLHLIQIIGMEENLLQVEPIWISEGKQNIYHKLSLFGFPRKNRNIYHKLSLVGFLKLEWNLEVLAVHISFGSIIELKCFLAQERNMRTSANKMELLHLIGLCVQSKV
jgi:hypothetical protein